MFKRKQIDVKVGEDFFKYTAADFMAGEVVAIARIADAIGLDSDSLLPLLEQLQESELLTCRDSVWSLTEAGWTRGRQLLRAHRVYESYLADKTGTPPSEWHVEADQHEHLLDTDQVDRTIFVLWRVIVFAVPAGAVIWAICNIDCHGVPLAQWSIDALDPIAWPLGLAGVIFLAYVVAILANEIVIPTVLMLTVMTTGMPVDAAAGAGGMFENSDSGVLHALFTAGR